MISIIVPVYNAGAYLEECLTSIRHQRYRDFEVILINDGSQDTSEAICQDFCQRDSRFRLISQTNHGAAHARNRGLEVAKGSYITFVDGDDYYPDDQVLEDFLRAAEEQQADIVVGGVDNIYSKGHLLRSYACQLLNRKEALAYFLKDKVTSSLCDKLFRAELLKNLYLDEHLFGGEDQPFIQEAFMRAERIYLIDQTVYAYRHQNGTSLSKRVKPEILQIVSLKQQLFAEICRVYPDLMIYEEVYLGVTLVGLKQRIDQSGQKDLQAQINLIFDQHFRALLKDPYVSFKTKMSAILTKLGLLSFVKRYLLRRV